MVFDRLYLQHPDSFFYNEEPLPPGRHHELMIRSLFDHNRIVCGAPRGSAKTKVVQKMMGTCLVTCPRFSVLYVGSTHKRVQETNQVIADIAQSNPAITHDFGPDWGGSLRPKRGEAIFGLGGFMRLSNGSAYQSSSIDSANRGGRPHLFILDDPEYDPETPESLDRLRAHLENFLFRQVIGMLDSANKKLFWVGTTISLRHYLTTALSVDENGEAKEPRFRFWHRMRFKAADRTPDGSFTNLLWPEKWSVDFLKLRELEMETAPFNAEYLNEPTIDESRAFIVKDPENAWWLESPSGERQPPSDLYANPYDNQLLMCAPTQRGPISRVPVPEFLRNCHIFTAADYALTHGPTSDFKTAITFALAPGNDLYILDCWAGRVPDDLHVDAILDQARRWRSSIIGIEAPGLYYSLLQQVENRLREVWAPGHPLPVVRAIPTHGKDKTSKILALRWRFGGTQTGSLIKFPLFLRHHQPWNQLFKQLENFTPILDNGGLEHDDLLDTVSMGNRLVLAPTQPLPAKVAAEDIVTQMRRGKTHDADGVPLGQQVNFLSLSKDDLNAIRDARRRWPTSKDAVNAI